MILRRIIDHFRNQEWTAIALDFAIVVLGVFLGLQVNNWNADRFARAQADDLLQRMFAEAEEARADMADYRASHAWILERALKLSVRLNAVDDCLAMDDEMKTLILAVGDFPPPRFSLATANEAIESDSLSVIGSADIRNEVRRMVDEMNFVEQQWQRYVRVKQDSEKAIYTAAGLSLTRDEALNVLPGNQWSGIDQYQLQTPEGVCGKTDMVAYASNAALTQHIYAIALGEVSDKLDHYAALLADHGGRHEADKASPP